MFEETCVYCYEFCDILSRNLHNLKKIHLSARSEALAVFLSNCDKLEDVSLYRGCAYVYLDKPAVVASCAKMCDTLTVLKLDALWRGDNEIDFIVRCRHLHTLYIHGASNISDVGLTKLRQLENLTSLGLGHTEHITSVKWMELMDKPPFTRLRSLKIWLFNEVNRAILYIMQMRCKQLKELTLHCYTETERREKAKIAEGIESLKNTKIVAILDDDYN
jgi:hypothetical protein